MVYLGQQDQDVDTESDHFGHLLEVIEKGVILVNGKQDLRMLAIFADLFCLDREPFWNNL